MISCFNHIKNPLVIKEIDIYSFIDQIKSPEQAVLELIKKARQHYDKNEYLYKYLKEQLPCFTLNFNFKYKKANENIKAPSGFIYLDLDNETDIDLTNKLIFATWKSLSNNGRGVLVKVNGLTINNFNNTYLTIAKKLNIEVDKNANKPTQYCIHSYDEDIYINNKSNVWVCPKEIAKTSPNSNLYLKKKRKDNTDLGGINKLRFNNISDYDFNGKGFLYFKNDKTSIANVFIPKSIKQGGRNNILSSIAYQIKSLNKNITFETFKRLMVSINYAHCRPILNKHEIKEIIVKAFNKEGSGPILNKERRFLFNPKIKLDHKGKMKIINAINGKKRIEKTLKDIESSLLKWDIKKQGKVTQKSLQKTTGKNIKTIEKYYHLFHDIREKINTNVYMTYT